MKAKITIRVLCVVAVSVFCGSCASVSPGESLTVDLLRGDVVITMLKAMAVGAGP
jgi:hypothetical protein